MDLRWALQRVMGGGHLSSGEMESALDLIISGQADPLQAAGLLVGLATRGESVEEVTGAARAMLAVALPFPSPHGPESIDTCGTGGDGRGCFNVSTAAAFVVAACGVPVCKHGNRAVSSQSGSADVLEALGARTDLPPQAMAEVFDETRLAFLMAPTYHPAVRHAMPIRRALGVRTLFNLLGPLINPARVRHQLMGVFDARWLVLIDALKELGARRAMIVHGQDGQDELSLTGPTRFAELHADGHVTRGEVSPEDVGLTRCSLDDLKGGDASHNAAILRAVMLHRATLPQTQAVQYSAGAALYLTGHASDLAQGARLAGEALQDGRARDTFERFIEATRRRAP